MVDATLGAHSYCGGNCVLAFVDIGAFCSLSDYIYIGGAAHPLEFVSTHPAFQRHARSRYASHEIASPPRTTIGSDVWIGHGAKLKPGITVGHGAAIGMGAVVTKDVPPYAILAGNPARIIRMRFDEEAVAALLGTEWWTWDEARLTRLGPDFNDPQVFLSKVKREEA